MADEDVNGLTGIPTATQADVTSLLLPMLLGWQVQLILFGLCLSLFRDYTISEIYSKHSRRYKAVLWIIMIFLVLASLLSAEECVYYLVWQQRTAAAILGAHQPSGIEPFLTGCVAALVQILLTLRASAFFERGAWLRTTFLAFNYILIALSFVGSVMVTAVAYLYVVGAADSSPFSFSTATLIWLIPAAVVDVSISFALYITLRKRANEGVAGWAFRAVITTALKTASYTSIMAVAGAALAVTAILANQSNATIDLPFALWLPMPSLYTLSLFTTLASNKSISRRLVERQDRSNNTGFQPGPLAAAYAIQPLALSPRPQGRTSAVSTTTESSAGRASQMSAEIATEKGKGKEDRSSL